jgi:hypothetical protein
MQNHEQPLEKNTVFEKLNSFTKEEEQSAIRNFYREKYENIALTPSQLKILKDMENSGVTFDTKLSLRDWETLKDTLTSREAQKTREKLERDKEKQEEKDNLLASALLEKIKGGEGKKGDRTLETPMIGDKNADVTNFQEGFSKKKFIPLMGEKFHEEIQELMASASPTTIRGIIDRFNNPFSYKNPDNNPLSYKNLKNLGPIEGITNNEDDAKLLLEWLKNPEDMPTKKEREP